MSNKSVTYTLSLRDRFSTGIKKALTSTNQLERAVGRTQRGFMGLGSALGVGLGAAGVVSFTKAVTDSLVNYEYFSTSLRTLMKGDALASKALEAELVSLAAVTPFGLREVQDATKQLIAYGFAAGDVTGNISMLGDVASALKIPFGDIAYLYGTTKTQGRVFARDILQFTNRGIPIIGELAKQFSISKEEVAKFVSEGKVGFEDIEKAFKTMTSEGGQFFNMMANQSETTGGQIERLGDAWEQLKVNIGQSQTGIIRGIISFTSDIVSNMTSAFQTMNSQAEAFAKHGAEAFTFWEKTQGVLTQLFTGGIMSSGYKDQMDFANSLKNIYGGASTKDQIENNINRLRRLFTSQKIAALGGELSYDEMKRRQATIKSLSDDLKGKLGLLNKKGEPATDTGGAAADGGKSTIGSTTSVEARQPQNFNITIDSLVEKMDINSSTITESAGEIKSKIARALIEAVNDFQIVATK